MQLFIYFALSCLLINSKFKFYYSLISNLELNSNNGRGSWQLVNSG